MDADGLPVTGATPTGSQIRVSKSGETFATGAGTWTEVGVGNYYYEATQLEVATDSYTFLLVAYPDTLVFPYVVDIGNRIEQGETLVTACRIPIFLKDVDGVGVAGLTLSGSEVQVSINGAAFVNGAGTIGETGQGAYYYQTTEVDDIGYVVLKVLPTDDEAEVYVYTFDIIEAVTEIADAGSYFGSYFGGPGIAVEVADVVTPATVVSPYTAEEPEYVDHVASALNRLPEYLRGD